jgi:protein-disulfide isomerase
MRLNFSRSLDILLVLCAVSTTLVVVGRLRGPSTVSGAGAGVSNFSGWREDLAFNRRIGSARAAYRLVVWTDYQCPACRQFEREIDSVKAIVGDSLSVVYRYFPLPVHPLAFRAAVAAECARRQDRFAAMHHALFATSLSGDSLPLTALAKQAAIPDEQQFRACTRDTAVASVVQADVSRGRELKLGGTPGVQVGNHIQTGGMFATELIGALRHGH